MSGRDRMAVGAIALALAAAILPVAGAVRWGALVSAGFGVAAALPYLTSRRRFARPPLLLLFVAVALALAALQVVPLPAVLVGLVSPHTLALVGEAHAIAGRGAPSFLPLSLDPPATLVELAKLCGYLGLAWAALRLAEHRRGRRALRLVVAGAGLALIAIALGHRLLGERKLLFGVYEPITYTPRMLTPFININHLSGLLVACSCVLLGMSLEASREKRVPYAIGALLCLGVSLLVPSRGAALGLVVGGAVVIALVLLRDRTRNRADRVGRSWIPLAGAVVSAALLFALFGSGIARELEETSTAELSDENSKFGAWRSALRTVGEHPLTGIGRGAFEPVFPSYHAASRARIYSHAENEYLQAVIDHGVAGGTLLVAGLVWIFVLAVRRGLKSAAAAGTTGALAVILTQNFFDFSLALPGTMAAFVILTATVTYDHVEVGGDPRRRLFVRVAAMLGAAMVITTAWITAPSLHEDRDALRERLAVRGARAADIEAESWPYMKRHPADALIAAEIARALYQVASPRAFAYLAWAEKRYPTHAGTQHLAARLLRSAGKSKQALGAYRAAIADADAPARYVRELAALYPDPEEVLRGLPTQARSTLAILSTLVAVKRTDAAVLYGQRLIDLGDPSAKVALVTAQAATRERDFPAAERLARRAHDRGAGLEGSLILSEALAGQGRTAEAADVLEVAATGARRSAERTAALQSLGKLWEDAGELEKARGVYKDLSQLQTAEAKVRAQAHQALGRIERRLGNANRASWEEARARDLLRR